MLTIRTDSHVILCKREPSLAVPIGLFTCHPSAYTARWQLEGAFTFGGHRPRSRHSSNPSLLPGS
jgi:hypothetical protein